MGRLERIALVTIGCVFLCGCGLIGNRGGSPPADDLLARAASAGMRSASITYDDHYTELGAREVPRPSVLHGDGSIIVLPNLHAHLTETNDFCAGGCKMEIVVDGTTRYTRSRGSLWWIDYNVAPDFDSYPWSGVLPDNLRNLSQARTVGEETLRGGAAWVVDATDAAQRLYQIWLRKSDFMPLRYRITTKNRPSVVDADLSNFNQAIAIATPSSNEWNPQFWGQSYRREQPIPMPGGQITVHNPKYDCDGGELLDDSLPASYPVLALFTYVSASGQTLNVDPKVWTLVGQTGISYPHVDAGAAPKLTPGVVADGQSAAGGLCFQISKSESNLTLVGHLPAGTVTVFLGGLIPTA